MIAQIQNLLNLFRLQLVDINADAVELTKLNSINRLSEKTISEISILLKDQNFDNEQEEIVFFKLLNPEVLSPPIEQGLIYNIVINKPITTNEALISYFEDALKIIQSYLVMNNFHYQYFKNGFTELDHAYFRRDSAPLTIPIIGIPVQVNEFWPPMSYLFAKFSAYENVQHYILGLISDLKISDTMNSLSVSSDQDTDIKWTGDAINIIEVAYGIWLTGQLNNGNATLTQIVRWLESSLKVTIGNIQSRFAEISSRKRLSPTKFIDQMKEAILKRIDNSNF